MKGKIKVLANAIGKNKRVILTVITIAGEIAAIYAAVKNGPKYEKVLDEFRKKKEAGEPVDKKEVIKELAVPTAKIAVPAAISITAAVLNHKAATEAIQSLTSLYSVTKTGDEIYKEAVKRIAGEEVAEQIDHETYKEKCFSDLHTGQVNTVYQTGHGATKFFDAWSGRYFISDANYIKKVMNDCNQRLMSEQYISLNEFYQDIDLQPVDGGKDIGWNSEYGMIDLYIDYVSDEGDQPLGIVKFTNAPSWRYMRW